MMNILLKAVGLTFAICFAGLAETPKPTVNDFAWLAGCWEANRNGREINEQWMKPSGGTMLGMARTIANGKTVEYEFVQIREEQDGAIYYVAKPSGQPEASFKLVKLQNRQATFENPEHDFPQRIIYRLEPDGSLFARVEGTSKGKARGFDYPMKHVHEEIFDADPETVFALLHTPSAIRQWWGATHAIIDQKEGGVWVAVWGDGEPSQTVGLMPLGS